MTIDTFCFIFIELIIIYFNLYIKTTLQMNKENNIKNSDKQDDEFNDLCESCKEYRISVRQNLILTGFKYCESCRISKTIFPL